MCGVRTKTDCRSRVVRKSIKSACVSRGHMRPRILSHLVLNGGLYTFRPSNFCNLNSRHKRRHNSHLTTAVVLCELLARCMRDEYNGT